MLSLEEIKQLLVRVRAIVESHGIIFYSALACSHQIMALLEISCVDINQIINSLEVNDFVKGPVKCSRMKADNVFQFERRVKSKMLTIHLVRNTTKELPLVVALEIKKISQ